MTTYFAYGSNVDHRQMLRRCPSAEVIGLAKASGLRLAFAGWSRSRGGSVATLEPAHDDGATVVGLLWKITEEDEAALDGYEGFPWKYDKGKIAVERIGVGKKRRAVEAMTYALPEGEPESKPADEYLAQIIVAYKANKIPKEQAINAARCAAETGARSTSKRPQLELEFGSGLDVEARVLESYLDEEIDVFVTRTGPRIPGQDARRIAEEHVQKTRQPEIATVLWQDELPGEGWRVRVRARTMMKRGAK